MGQLREALKILLLFRQKNQFCAILLMLTPSDLTLQGGVVVTDNDQSLENNY